MGEKKRRTHHEVYLFVPNLIGYTRVALTGAGIYMLHQAQQQGTDGWVLGLVLYTSSFVLDFFDGYFARMLNQSSDFGAVLDMVTDRVSTMLLLVVLCCLYPEYFAWFALLAALDYSSHWVQMYSAKAHHKTSNQDKNLVVRFYYNVYPFFGFCCVGTELFYIAMTILNFQPHNQLVNLSLPVLFVACGCKNIVNVAQLLSGFECIAKRDVSDVNPE